MAEIGAGSAWVDGGRRRRVSWLAIAAGAVAIGAFAGVVVRVLRSLFNLPRQPAILITAGLVFFVMWLWRPAPLRASRPRHLVRRLLSAGAATMVLVLILWTVASLWS